jgi:hypothetical protein
MPHGLQTIKPEKKVWHDLTIAEARKHLRSLSVENQYQVAVALQAVSRFQRDTLLRSLMKNFLHTGTILPPGAGALDTADFTDPSSSGVA